VKYFFITTFNVLVKAFKSAVVDDGGTVISDSATKNSFLGTQNASFVCPCTAVDEGKIYIWEF
jgi:hypothetical protein